MSDNPNIKPALPVRAGAYQGVIHTHLDERGVAWIDDTNVKVVEVVADKRGGYATAEAIHEAHPDISLAQIHAALAYYYDHQQEVDAYMKRMDREVEEMRAQAAPKTEAWRKKLRARAAMLGAAKAEEVAA